MLEDNVSYHRHKFGNLSLVVLSDKFIASQEPILIILGIYQDTSCVLQGDVLMGGVGVSRPQCFQNCKKVCQK